MRRIVYLSIGLVCNEKQDYSLNDNVLQKIDVQILSGITLRTIPQNQFSAVTPTNDAKLTMLWGKRCSK